MKAAAIVAAGVVLIPLLAASAESVVGEENIRGAWSLAEKNSVIDFQREADGAWTGKIVESATKEEVGKLAFKKLVYSLADRRFTGILVKPEDNSEHAVTVTLTTEKAMKAVVRKFILTKTLEFTKK